MDHRDAVWMNLCRAGQERHWSERRKIRGIGFQACENPAAAVRLPLSGGYGSSRRSANSGLLPAKELDGTLRFSRPSHGRYLLIRLANI
jgi:hypothetical protein